MARLRQLDPDGTTTGPAREIGGGLTLGRAPDCDVVLDDERISRHHARVSGPGPECVVEDLGSANGVFVGEARITRASVAPGQPFRIGATWFVVEADTAEAAAEAPVAPAAPPPPARGHGRTVGCAVLGCLGLIVLVAAGLAWFLWTCCAPPPAGAPSPPPAGADAGARAPSAPSVPPPDSVPLTEADVLRFTLRIASNPVLAGCASMPEAWHPPFVEVPLAARVLADGAFRFERDWTHAGGEHHIEGTGTWKDGALAAQGRWSSRRAADSATQEDEGSFTAAGRLLLGSWFGDRVEAEFSSRLGDASCREPISNGLSRVEELKW